MTAFFSVTHNSFQNRRLPWIQRIVAGLERLPRCHECGVESYWPVGDLQVTLEPDKANQWPDVLGCGAHPLLVVSSRVLDSWQAGNVGVFPVHRVEIVAPLPRHLVVPPAYFWVDGAKMFGARMDFEASGFVGVQFCSTCGRRWDEVSKTYDRQHSGVWPLTFLAGTWTGANLFVTDLSPTAFFCTETVVKCASENRHTNFRFIPVEQGDAASSKGLVYIH